MKDDEAIKTILDLKNDNIKQERELFKHIAILSSAIVGIFVFNGNYDLGRFVIFGVIGLFVVIIISVFLLYVIIRTERNLIERARIQISEIKDIRVNSIKSSLSGFINKESLQAFQKLFKDWDIIKSSVDFTPIFIEAYSKIKEGDKKIEKEKNKYKNNQSIDFISFISWFSIIIFIVSLVLILVGLLSN